VFTSPKTTNWVYTPPGEITPAEAAPEPDHTRLERGHTDGDSLGQTSIDSPRSKLGSEAKPEPPQEAPKPRRVAQQPRYEREAMFEGNPFSRLFNW